MADRSPPGDGGEDQFEDTPQPDPDHPAVFPADDPPALPPGADAGATHALARFLTLSPFLDLHDRAGDPGAHVGRERVCFVLDLVVRLVVVGLLLGVIVAVTWKTLAPFPAFWQSD